MKKPVFRLFALLLCFALLTGCNKNLFDPELAIEAPRATGEYQGVQTALENAVGEDIILQYPSVRGVNTAFCLVDVDGDNTEEVLAFYKLSTEGAVTRAHLLRMEDDEWQSVQDIEPVGTDIIHVEFCDLSGDGVKEVCIGWGVATAQTNQMSVYQTVDRKLVQCASEAYTKYILCDINNDQVQELGLATLDSKKQTSSLSFYKIQNNAIRVIGTIALDGSVISYANITAAGITEKITGVYLDAYKGVDTMITELVYFTKGALYNPFAGADNAVNISTMRYCSLTAQDVNSDGVVEIPFMELLPAYEKTKDQSITHYTIGWRYYNGNISQPVSTWWYNPVDGYYLAFDNTWRGHFTVLYNDTEKAYVFYEWDGKAVGEVLFFVKTFTPEEWKAGSSLAYEKLGESGSAVWAVSVNAANNLSVTYDKLKSNFRVISD